jgi:DnaJ-class molecular chaperone
MEENDMGNMSDIITCSKCCGSGKFIYKSGVVGHCYQCDGKGVVKRIAHKSFTISIVNNDGARIDWLHMSARSEKEAIGKARVVAARGCYKNQLDTITATESGIEYTFKTI